jgi:hypothetical protein
MSAKQTDGARMVTASDDKTARVWDTHWATQARGSALRDRVCREKLAGAEAFTLTEAEDPILDALERTRPCDRVGPLSLKYWGDLAGGLRQEIPRFFRRIL